MSLPRGSGLSYTADSNPAAWLFEHGHDLFVILDSEFHILQANPAWTRLLGWPLADLIGRAAADFMHPDDLHDARERDEVLTRTGSVRQVHRLAVKGGGWRWFDGIAHRQANGGRIGVMRDVTEQRAHEAERDLMRTQRTLLASKAGLVGWTLDGTTGTFLAAHPRPLHAGSGQPSELTGADLQKLTHPDDIDHARAMLGRAITEGVDGSYEVRMQTPAGGDWLTYRVSYLCELRDGRWLVHGLSQDITDVARARDAARAAQQEAHGLLENAPFASCILGPDLEYISVSAAWKALFSPYTDMMGRTFAFLQTPATRRRMHRALKRALAGEVYSRAEDEIERPGGTLILRWQARPWRTPAGEVRGVIVYATDITDVVVARRAARANVKRLKLALEAADAAVFEIDYVNKTFWAGDGLKKLTGRAITYEEALGPWPSIHPDDLPQVAAQIASFDTHRPEPLECRMQSEGQRWTRSHIRIQHDAQGRPRRAVGLIQDIHAQKQQAIALANAERQANIASEAKSNFLANISHEIRTPMNGVLGVMQLIKRDHLDADERALLDEALVSGRMLTEMLDDLVDFSKIETGQFELHLEALDPTAILIGVASLLEPVASAKGLKMTAIAAPDLGLVKADPLRLRQALYNIMGNAVKFTPQGSIEARLARHTAPDGSERLRFEVQDTGIGVSEEFQATLFERFEQADGSATRKYGGSGLGLAITKRLAEMMGGAVGFCSNPGQGSTFWIEIDGAAVEPSEAVAADEPDVGDFRVLLVEDNPTNRLVISKILEALGVKVDMAEDGTEGVKLAASGKYDLVLMDIQMPGMDGIEATRRIRAMDGAVGSTPIVAITANVLAHQRTSYTDAGMDGVVSKPVSAASLIAEIARVTERSAAA